MWFEVFDLSIVFGLLILSPLLLHCANFMQLKHLAVYMMVAILICFGCLFSITFSGEVISEEYSLEYGTDIMEMHVGAVQPGDRALVIDDLIATGGTLCAAIKLLGKLVNLDALSGRKTHLHEIYFSAFLRLCMSGSISLDISAVARRVCCIL